MSDKHKAPPFHIVYRAPGTVICDASEGVIEVENRGYLLSCHSPDVAIAIRSDGRIEVDGLATSQPEVIGEAFMLWARHMSKQIEPDHGTDPGPDYGTGDGETQW